MPVGWPRCSIPWLVTSFPSSGYQPQFAHGEAIALQVNQMRASLLTLCTSEEALALQHSREIRRHHQVCAAGVNLYLTTEVG
jgi:hypothetical protein